MRQDVKTLQGSTRRGWWMAAIAGAAVLGAATGAEAGEGHWKKHHRYFVPPGHVYYAAPPPVYYYRPAPVVMYPEPVYVRPYRYYSPAPSISVTLPLR